MLNKKAIAFADSNLGFVSYRMEALEELGFTVWPCSDAGEVIQLFKNQSTENPTCLYHRWFS